jgi:RNA polymerase sigma-70 factor (ECF subfamily)
MALPWFEWILAPRDEIPPRAIRGREESHARKLQLSESSDDPTIIERIRAGDVAAFEQLFRAHYNDLITFATHLLGVVDTAEDVVQTVLWDVWQHRERLDATRSIRGYLFASIRNRARNAARDSSLARTRAWEAAMEARLLNTNTDDASSDAAREEFAVVARVIGRISERDREILLLRVRGLTFAEIGDALELPLKTVATRCARTLDCLRQLVRESQIPEE